MKDRNIICEHYIRHGECEISKKSCSVNGVMQHCHLYSKDKTRKPFRENRKKAREEKIRERDLWKN